MTILFAQGIHSKEDDRVFYHQKTTLEKQGIKVEIRSFFGDDMPFCKHIRHIRREITACKPDVVVCDTPKTVLAASGTGARVIYDVTEWYPGHVALGRRNVFTPLKWCAMVLLNWLAGCKTDRFIFGETDKGKPFRFCFPWKRYVYMPYYPSKRFFLQSQIKPVGKQCNLFYAGPQTAGKGWTRVQETLRLCRQLRPDIDWQLIAISPDQYLPLPEFCNSLGNVHFALDLRDIDKETTRCLPIKLFYYMASGCVPVYSDLKAIRQGVPEIETCARLVTSAQQAAKAIIDCLNPDTYCATAEAGRTLFEQKYNWETIEDRLTAIVA